MKCDGVEPLIPDWLDGRLPADADDAVTTHLGACPACRTSVSLVVTAERAGRSFRDALHRARVLASAEATGPNLLARALAWIFPEMPAFGLAVAASPALGTRRHVELRLTPEGEDAVVVVLRRRGRTGWRWIFPLSQEEAVRWSELPTGPDGARIVDVDAGDGREAWAIALLPPEDLDWQVSGATRRRRLRAALARGSVRAAVASVSR